MINILFRIINLIRIFLIMGWLHFTEYIEFCDAIALAFFTWASAQAFFDFSSGVGIALGVTLGIAFLVLFRTRIGWWISTGVFSFMWASAIAYLVDRLFHVNSLVHWVIVAIFFLYFAWLHHYAIYRKETRAEILAEEKAKLESMN